jgi:hypothetical protein
MPRKISMTLHNGSTPRVPYVGITSPSSAGSSISSMPSALNSRMIDRIYSAKPGCSACGKK